MALMKKTAHKIQRRFELPSISRFILYFLFLVFFVWSCGGAKLSFRELYEGLPHMARVIREMNPPDFSRAAFIGKSLLVTFQMALVGTFAGVIGSFFLAIFASRSQTPHVSLYYVARFIISFCRSVPDLVWAIFFVASVGLGPFAGTLTIMIDTIGFCGRFFAEAMEEVEQGPQEALAAIGASRFSIIAAAVAKQAMPSFVNSSLFALEKAVRASVVLGLVGAGGIGIELKVAMDLFQYQQAGTIILSIFALVVCVEQTSSFIRRKIM